LTFIHSGRKTGAAAQGSTNTTDHEQAIGGAILRKQPLTPGYIFFYLLFSPDTWRILIGLTASYLLIPSVVRPGMGVGAKLVLYLMMAAIGYAASAAPGRGIAAFFRKRILKK
jgi:hypothetical protein